MKLSWRWLGRHVDLEGLTPEGVADDLTLSVAEVEGLERFGAVLDDVTVEAGAQLLPYSVCSQSTIGPVAKIGPFTHLRPASRVDEGAKVGNFCEVKKSVIGKGSKVNHLTYIGDAEIGENANIGAGTITCNYDGANKFKTVIGNDVFIGSDSQLVAPVTIADGSTVGAGTTLTKDVAEGELVITRAKERKITGWQRPVKQK